MINLWLFQISISAFYFLVFSEVRRWMKFLGPWKTIDTFGAWACAVIAAIGSVGIVLRNVQ